jgi:hypothetical protein
VLCLQETKVTDEQFPLAAFTGAIRTPARIDFWNEFPIVVNLRFAVHAGGLLDKNCWLVGQCCKLDQIRSV